MDALLLRSDGKIEKLPNHYGDRIRWMELSPICMNYNDDSILDTPLPLNYKECPCAFTIDQEFGIYPEDSQMTIRFKKERGRITMAWTYWVSNSSSTTATTNSYWDNDSTTGGYTSTNYTWNRWQTCTITSTSASTNTLTVWGEWNNGTLTVYQDNSTWSDWVITENECHVGKINYEQVRPPTEEERKRYEQERIRMAELAKERERKAKEADEKALALLEENLTEDQRQVFKETGVIPVQCQSGRRYHIRKGIAGNVHELDEKGATKRRLCFHPSDCPVYDVMLSQKLILEICEEDALKIANFS